MGLPKLKFPPLAISTPAFAALAFAALAFAALAFAALAALPAPPARADTADTVDTTDTTDTDADPPRAVGVFQGREGGAILTEIVLPGRILSTAPWPDADGRESRHLAVLLEPEGPPEAGDEPEERPRALYRLGGESTDLDPIATDLPADLDSVVLAPGHGLWLGSSDQLFALDFGGPDLGSPDFGGPGLDTGTARPTLRPLLGSQGRSPANLALANLDLANLDLDGLDRRGLLYEGGLALPEVGRLRLFTLDPEGILRQTGEARLPVEVSRRRTGLALRGLPVHRVAGDGRALFVAGPEHLSHYRRRHLLIDPFAPIETDSHESSTDGSDARRPNPGETDPGATNPGDTDPGDTDRGRQISVIETFTLSDQPESIEQVLYTRLDDRPTFFATTSRANKIGVFEEQRARVHRLATDRTRAGKRPMLLAETVSKKWFAVGIEVLDFDADGKDDLVLVQPEGMGGGELVVELYRGRGNGFERKTRRSKLKHDPSDWHFGQDWDGDGTADLLLVGRQIHIYRGLAGTGRRLLEKTPWLSISRAETYSHLVEVHIDSQGAEAEAVHDDRGRLSGRLRLLGAGSGGTPRIVVFRHHPGNGNGESDGGRGVVRFVDLGH